MQHWLLKASNRTARLCFSLWHLSSALKYTFYPYTNCFSWHSQATWMSCFLFIFDTFFFFWWLKSRFVIRRRLPFEVYENMMNSSRKNSLRQHVALSNQNQLLLLALFPFWIYTYVADSRLKIETCYRIFYESFEEKKHIMLVPIFRTSFLFLCRHNI